VGLREQLKATHSYSETSGDYYQCDFEQSNRKLRKPLTLYLRETYVERKHLVNIFRVNVDISVTDLLGILKRYILEMAELHNVQWGKTHSTATL
jgi:hypothetical protein